MSLSHVIFGLTTWLHSSVNLFIPFFPAAFNISPTTSYGPPAFPAFMTLIASSTSFSLINSHGPSTLSPSSTPSQSFSILSSLWTLACQDEQPCPQAKRKEEEVAFPCIPSIFPLLHQLLLEPHHSYFSGI